ncbi:MAG: hypothetical protein EHM61_24545 [Acidobacteria bacterium]|nr:MAG: hypothetical protein EHM61_24545 [Acidobacteriota bacterium]
MKIGNLSLRADAVSISTGKSDQQIGQRVGSVGNDETVFLSHWSEGEWLMKLLSFDSGRFSNRGDCRVCSLLGFIKLLNTLF